MALTRASGTLQVWVNGAAKGSASFPGAITHTPGQPLCLGLSNTSGGATWLEAYFDEVRITTGVARYTAGFAAPSSAFEDYVNTVLLLHFDKVTNTLYWADSSRYARRVTCSPSFPAALSSTVSKFGGYAAYFSGSPAYMNVADAPELNLARTTSPSKAGSPLPLRRRASHP